MLWSSKKVLIFNCICLFHFTFPERHSIIDHAIPEAVKKMDILGFVWLWGFFVCLVWFFLKGIFL